MNRTTSLTLCLLVLAACAAGSGSGKSGRSGGDNTNGQNADGGTGNGGQSGSDNDDGSDENGGGDHGPGPISGNIEVEGGTSLTVSGAPSSVQVRVVDSLGNPVENLDWSTDDTRIGSVSKDGTFTANGFVGGEVTVTARGNNGQRSVTITVDVDIVDNPANLSPSDQSALAEGGGSDVAFRWLYPYAGTVFPRGVLAPVLQLGGNADAVYLEITAPHYRYRQYASTASRIQLNLREEVWRGLSLTVLPQDEATVKVTKKSGATVSGPVVSTWRFASADLTGIVYYSTYNYKDDKGESNGAIMRIRPGRQAEVVQSGCTVCHTVSAHGNVLATGIGYWAEGEVSGDPETFNPTDSGTFSLDQMGGVTALTRTTEGRTFSFMALSPDGKVGLSNGIPPAKFPPYVSRGIYSGMGFPSRLYDTTSGAEIAAPSLAGLVKYAQYPAFSPDGSRVVFVDGDRLALDANDRVLSVMDVDLTASPPVFSNLRHVLEKTKAVAWPSFLPDGVGVIYHEGDSHDSSLFNMDANAPAGAQYAELRLVDVERGLENPLYALNGRDEDGNFYLPYGGDEEGRMNYEASVLPVAVGGYYWVLFASRRAYGNIIAPNGEIPRGDDPWGTEANPSPRKKIWIAAIDVNYRSKKDPSHPAFYLPGQDINAGNMRAYAALAPCKPNGESCVTGSDCCEGFCRETSRDEQGVPVLSCVERPPTCSNIDEPCDTPDDCCDTSLLCVNNRCTVVPVL